MVSVVHDVRGCRPCAAHLSPHGRGRRKREAVLLQRLLADIVALRQISSHCGARMNRGYRLRVVEQVHVTHALRRRVCRHLLLLQPMLHVDPVKREREKAGADAIFESDLSLLLSAT